MQRFLALQRGDQVAYIGAPAGQHVVVKALLPINEGGAVLQLGDLGAQGPLLFGQHDLALGDGARPLQAENQVILHFLDAHAALFQADRVLDPGDVMRIKDAAVVFVPLDIGHQPLCKRREVC